jgi:hypothetical protein
MSQAMESRERPTVRELLSVFRRLEGAVRIILARISSEMELETAVAEGDPDLETIRAATMGLSGITEYQEVASVLSLGINEFQFGNAGRAKVRFSEALHLVVKAPIRLLDRPGTDRSVELSETETGTETETDTLSRQ